MIFHVILFISAVANAGEAVKGAAPSSSPLVCSQLVASFPDRHQTPGLTPFWAQEYVGADLAKSALKALAEKKAKTPVGIIDEGFKIQTLAPYLDRPANSFSPRLASKSANHGNPVAELIFHPDFGTAGSAALSTLASGIPPGSAANIKLMTSSNARVVNLSAGIVEEALPALKAFFDKGKILVMATGNDYPSDLSLPSHPNMIQVANLAPEGLPALNTNIPSGTDIFAPADELIWSRGPDGKPYQFGGTSASAPLVTGAIANVLALAPNLKVEDIRTLLRKTAIPSWATQMVSGTPGVLNAYKLVRVAERIQSGVSLNEPAIFDFSSEASAKLKEGQELFAQDDCDKKAEGLRKIRESFLLEPSSESAKTLSAIYGGLGFKSNAGFYRVAKGSEDEIRTYTSALASSERKNLVFSFASRLPAESPIVRELASTLRSRLEGPKARRLEAVQGAGQMGEHGVSILREVAVTETDSEIRKAIIDMISEKINNTAGPVQLAFERLARDFLKTWSANPKYRDDYRRLKSTVVLD